MARIYTISDCRTLVRFGAYTVLIALLSAMLPVIVDHGDVYIFSEGGPVEWFQAALLLGASIVFMVAGTCRKNSGVDVLLAMTAMIALVREMDSLLDRLIPFGGWCVPATVLLVAAIGLCWKRRDILPQCITISGSQCFVLLWCGFILAVPFGQLLGHGNFLRSLMGDDYNRNYKRVIEELCELVGYMFILMGSFESLIVARNGEPKPRRGDAEHDGCSSRETVDAD